MRETHPVTPSEMGHVLIADDQKHILDALQMLLGSCGFSTKQSRIQPTCCGPSR